MATPNYETMAQDLAILLHKWEQEDMVDIVDDPDQIMAGALVLAPLVGLAIRLVGRLRRR